MNKGFTLIEILVVIAILGVISTIVGISLTATLNSTHQKECDSFVKEIEDAACTLVGLTDKEVLCPNNNCTPINFKLDTLIKEGLIDSEIDVCTGNDIDLSSEVEVTWNDQDEKICHYKGVRKYER